MHELILENVLKSLFVLCAPGSRNGLYMRFEWLCLQSSKMNWLLQLNNDLLMKRITFKLGCLDTCKSTQESTILSNYTELLMLSESSLVEGMEFTPCFENLVPHTLLVGLIRPFLRNQIFLFVDQFNHKVLEKENITKLSIFVELLFVNFWNEAPLAT